MSANDAALSTLLCVGVKGGSGEGLCGQNAEKLWLGKNSYFCGSSFITCVSVGLIVFICWQRIREFIGGLVVLTLSSS